MLRSILAGACLAAGIAASAGAADVPLNYEQAQQLALDRQPLIQAQESESVAAKRRSDAAGALPDPVLNTGVTDLTLDGPDRFTLRKETDTQLMVGIRQDFPGGDKRELRQRRAQQQANQADRKLEGLRRQLRRDAGLDWIDVWKADRAVALTQLSAAEAATQADAVAITLRAGRATQADLLAAQVSKELLDDRVASLRQEGQHARNQLARWIGDAGLGAVAQMPPSFSPPTRDALLANLQSHPHYATEAADVAISQTDVALAQQDYKPDWSVGLGYSYRPAFADYLQLQFEVGLPVFGTHRQTPLLEASRAELEASQDRLADALREHSAEIKTNWDDWQTLQVRLARYDSTLIPQAQQRCDAALGAYKAGQGTLAAVLDARRMALDVQLQRLDLEADFLKHGARLQFYAP